MGELLSCTLAWVHLLTNVLVVSYTAALLGDYVEEQFSLALSLMSEAQFAVLTGMVRAYEKIKAHF